MSRQIKVTVTGAGGFIGHHLCKYLVEHGYWVRGVDVKEPEYERTAGRQLDHVVVVFDQPAELPGSVDGEPGKLDPDADHGGRATSVNSVSKPSRGNPSIRHRAKALRTFGGGGYV